MLPPHAVVLNIYGSAEVSADCTCFNATEWLRQRISKDPVMQRGQGQPAGQKPIISAVSAAAAAAAQAARQGSQSDKEVAASQGQSLMQREQAVPVGWPIDNMAVFIAAPLSDEEPASKATCDIHSIQKIGGFNLLPPGCTGEVCIAGAGVCSGYLG